VGSPNIAGKAPPHQGVKRRLSRTERQNQKDFLKEERLEKLITMGNSRNATPARRPKRKWDEG